MNKLLSIVLVLTMSVFVAACAGRSVQEGVAVEDKSNNGDGTGSGSGSGSDSSSTGLNSGGSDSTTLGGDGTSGSLAGVGEDDPLSKRTVYFEYDSSNLTAESRGVVEAHAAYVAANPGLSLTLEGHADERGTREYNLALGESRAKSVERLMQALGVAGGSTQTISYGEERPIALGEGEETWSLNRRVEILYGN